MEAWALMSPSPDPWVPLQSPVTLSHCVTLGVCFSVHLSLLSGSRDVGQAWLSWLASEAPSDLSVFADTLQDAPFPIKLNLIFPLSALPQPLPILSLPIL